MNDWKQWMQPTLAVLIGMPLFACTQSISNNPQYSEADMAAMSRNVDDQLIVDCLLPGRVKKLGGMIFQTARKPTRNTVNDCRLAGGEYPIDGSRNSYLDIWLSKAQAGDQEAQNYVGEIYEKGLGVPPDYSKAAEWYRKAANQGFSRAQNNLGFLYEKGLGVPGNSAEALNWYRRAAHLDEAINIPNQGISSQLKALQQEVSRKSRETETLRQQLKEAQHRLEKTLDDLNKIKTNAGRTRTDTQALRDLESLKSEYKQREAQLSKKLAALENELKKSKRSLDKDQVTLNKRVLTGMDFGTYHALIIGNADYRSLDRLNTSIRDAQVLDRILKKKYGFKTTLLLDATREKIIDTLSRFRRSLVESDNLLIYYAGHGELDGGGFWQPIDAKSDSPANWISNADLTNMLEQMRALHVLVVADSCYSGTLTRDAFAKLDPDMSEKERVAWIKKRARLRSRTAIASGGVQPVLDTGQGEHSVFAHALLRQLEQNDEIIDSRLLFDRIAPEVLARARVLGAQQQPEYARLQAASDENGEFYFKPVTRQAAVHSRHIAGVSRQTSRQIQLSD